MRFILVLVLFAFGSLPAGAAVLASAAAKHQDAQIDLDTRLTDVSRTAEFQLTNDLDRFRQILLTSSQNPALVQVVRDPERGEFWKTELDRALLQLTTTFPGMIDEACRIDARGVELGRVVKGEAAPDDDLSSDESENNPAFWPTMALPSGAVHYQAPYLSPDTKRWVLAASTPLYVDGKATGILHFEVPLSYYQGLLKTAVPGGGFLIVADLNGQVYLDSSAPDAEGGALSNVNAALARIQVDSGSPTVATGDVAFGLWSNATTSYRVRAQTVEPAPGLRMRVLVGVPVVPAFGEQLTSLVGPLALGGLLLVLFATAVAGFFVQALGVGGPRPTRGTRPGGSEPRSWAILLLALLFAAAVAVGLGLLNQTAYRQQDMRVVLARLNGHVALLDELADHLDAEPATTQEHARSAADVQRQVVEDLTQLGRLDTDEAVTAHLKQAFDQYQADLDETVRLIADGREAEAHLWHQQRAHASLSALDSQVEDASAVAQAAAARMDALVNVASTLALSVAALFMGLLAWRFTHTRRAADLLATEQQALRRSEERFRKLVQHGADLVVILDPAGTVRYCSPSVCTLLGDPPERLVGASVHLRVHPDDETALCRALEQPVADPRHDVRAEFRLRHADGTWRHVEAVCRNLIADPEIGGLVLNARDVTERTLLQNQLAHRAFHDELTELPNRALLIERLEHSLARARRTAQTAALVFVDLDDFKLINDSLGHRAGDQLLVGVAQRLRACLRPGDTAARLGGDEFVVLLEDLGHASEATSIAERFAEQLRAPFVLDGREVFVGASLGIAAAEATDETLPEDLLRRADLAMYAAKTRGKGQVVVYETAMDNRPLERLELEADLRRALERQEFRLYYQPIVDLQAGRVSGVEALLRWQHPERGLVPPGAFIPLAEETGLIVPIARWVLGEACQQAQAWASRPDQPPLVMSVNLSGRQFQDPRLLEDVAEALRVSGLPPANLKLEITESIAMEAGATTIQTLEGLRALGVKLAIDDFGTGYSSLAYLKRFPVDTLKIDRAFVDGLGRDEQDTAIVRSVIALARTLGLSVTAEGIETVEQLQELCAAGCDEGQGYYLGKPQPADRVQLLLGQGLLRLPPTAQAA